MDDVTDINERIARLRGWDKRTGASCDFWLRGKAVISDWNGKTFPPYTTDPALILELVEDKHISVTWIDALNEWWALAYKDETEGRPSQSDPDYGTAVALAWLAGEEEK